MNPNNPWKTATIVLIVFNLMLLCCVGGVLLGLSLGSRSRTIYHGPPTWYRGEPELPLPLEEEARPWLGVYFEMVEEGAVIRDVLLHSPADRAGLQVEDVIIEVEGEAVTFSSPLNEIIEQYRPGEEIELRLLREDDEESVRVRLGIRPPDPEPLPGGGLIPWTPTPPVPNDG